MNHQGWVLFYVAVALGTFGLAFGSMSKLLRDKWQARCACCEERLSWHYRGSLCTLTLVVFVLRSALWPIVIPAEFLWLIREVMKNR